MDLNARQLAEFVGEIGRHQAALRAYIISLMPGMDGVSDVLQETNLVLWEKRGKFQPGTNFGAWAFTIARLEVKSHRRRLRKAGLILLDEDLAESLAGLLADRLAERADGGDARLRALDRCLGRLAGAERELIEHRYYSNSPLDGFAARCGRSVESLRVTLFRIRAALRRCINDEIAVKRARS
jgi:RNA polymerase sigma-70 factor (ECF subfamily)